MSDLTEREVVIFIAARRLPLGERMAYLEEECAGDAALRQKLDALLSVDEAEGEFLEQPAQADLGAAILPVEFSELCHQLFEKPGDRIGPYKLLQQIGEGGCGVVYVAEQEAPIHRRVALKVIKLGMDTRQVIARFDAERQALALMEHTNIAKALDAGVTEAGRPYFVMELVRGVKITTYCNQNRLTTEQRLQLFIQVCRAVQHAHQKGIIHRDLKPSNILVTVNEPGAPGVPKVIDFGIAKATQGKLTDQTVHTEFEQFLGTPAYMSPEQAVMTNFDIDTRSDIYSLGVLLYELLTGRTPFETAELLAAGMEAMRRTIREREPMRPSTRLSTMVEGELATAAETHQTEVPRLIHQVKGDLDWIVMKCLEKDRARRYETANGLAADVQRHLNNEPVVARPPSTVYLLQKAWRRNKLALSAAVTLVLALVAGISVSSWQAIEANRARDAEKQARLQADAEKAKAGQLLYVADMNLAQQAWEGTNIVRLKQLLADTKDYPDRGFEWYFWQRLAHAAGQMPCGHLDGVTCAAYSPDGQRIATGGYDGAVTVRDAAKGGELFALNGHTGPIGAVAFSPDGRRMVSGSWDKTAKVWELATSNLLFTLKGRPGAIRSVAFSPDGRRIATGGNEGAEVWDANSGKLLLTFLKHSDRTMSLAFSPDGRRIVTGSWDQTAKVWEVDSGNVICTLTGHDSVVWAVAYSPDGQRVVTAGTDGTAKVWDTASWRELFSFKDHSGEIRSAAFFPDSRRVITGGADLTARIWEVANGHELLTLRGHSNSVVSLAISPDNQRMITVGQDHTASVWEAASAAQVAAWQEAERIEAQALAARQHEQLAEDEHHRMVQTRDSIKQWLILAPIALANGQSGSNGVDIEQIKGEARLRPRAGESVSVAGTELKWRPVVLKDYLIDFNAILGRTVEHRVAYAVCYLRSDTERRGLRLLVGSDDEAKIYLNGKLIYKSLETRMVVEGQDTVPDVVLNAGLNVLVFKIVNEEAGWGGAIRFTDAQGNPVPGIEVTLDPETKSRP